MRRLLTAHGYTMSRKTLNAYRIEPAAAHGQNMASQTGKYMDPSTATERNGRSKTKTIHTEPTQNGTRGKSDPKKTLTSHTFTRPTNYRAAHEDTTGNGGEYIVTE